MKDKKFKSWIGKDISRKKECKKHDWRIGAYIGNIRGKRIIKEGIYIKCYKCNKTIKAYYNFWRKSK